MRLNSVHAIIIFDEMQNGAIWAASATAKMSFSVLRRLKTCVSSAMKNDRLSSLGLMHVHRDFEVALYKAMEVIVSTKTRS
jgi:hypothetical protein